MTRTLRNDLTVVAAGVPTADNFADGIRVVANAATHRETVELTRAHRPDVLLIDLHRPELGGLTLTREIRNSAPATAILVVTTRQEAELVVAAMRAGAMGYLLEDATPDDIARAIRGVAAGAAVFGQAIANQVLSLLRAPKPLPPFPQLSSREHEVLELVAVGLGNTAIARRLDLAPKTVRNHVSSILAKLGAVDRARVIIKARGAGLGDGL
ncbi:DNA-binding response regulator, NarL/FixJ family, contains REC and HTH domains [Amycolatopsis xylanica]|uniref:DNA-binding response regulator, NarL/FixJ family, contains REC and HTH domains n=1 Tax=Amycolatopsis xylanica TaxID=589385 RepID=A0A1H3F1T8_9PSEU|nr:response regulator transcription factor [Amycolatopsis xylanica]SDX84144.1 DNA-binding response regulator, NarL/FixJ family, contains REC and HTH domains [Amycolatopsis xylanica]